MAAVQPADIQTAVPAAIHQHDKRTSALRPRVEARRTTALTTSEESMATANIARNRHTLLSSGCVDDTCIAGTVVTATATAGTVTSHIGTSRSQPVRTRPTTRHHW